jgi:hypothetical protein
VHRIRIVSSLLAADKIKSQLIPYIDCKWLHFIISQSSSKRRRTKCSLRLLRN